MDEYQFQHEQSPELQEQAAAAVNRTLWLQHWKLAPYKLYLLIWGYIPIGIQTFVDYLAGKGSSGTQNGSADGFHTSDILPIFMMLSGLLIWILLFLHLFSKTQRLNQVKSIVEIPKKIIWILCGVASIPLLFFGFGTLQERLNITFFIFLLFDLGTTAYEFHVLQRNLIKWGVIEDTKAIQALDNTPISKQLSQAETIIDQSLGAPLKSPAKRRLFIRTKPI